MIRFKTILHPTDFSPTSAHAFHLACSLARDHAGRVVVLHVADRPLVAPSGQRIPPPPGGAQQAIEDELCLVRPADPDIPVEHRLEEGDPVAEIVRAAHDLAADLIVMGTHGRTGLGHFLTGSVAEQVVRKAPCPVLTLKAGVHDDADA